MQSVNGGLHSAAEELVALGIIDLYPGVFYN